MSYDGEVREDDWCSNYACYVWQCPKPRPAATPPAPTTDPRAEEARAEIASEETP